MTGSPHHPGGHHPGGDGRRQLAPCGPDCRYRALYEGAQLTLASIGERQADALSRVGALRNEIVKALRHLHPAGFVEAERRVGKRLSDVDDALIVGYLQAFIAEALTGTPAGMATLRDALTAAGYPLPPGDDPAAWAAAVTSSTARTATPAPTAAPPATGASGARPVLRPAQHAASTVDDLADLFAGDDPAVTGSVADLADLFGDDEPAGGPTTSPDGKPADVEPFTDDAFADDPADTDPTDVGVDDWAAGFEPEPEPEPEPGPEPGDEPAPEPATERAAEPAPEPVAADSPPARTRPGRAPVRPQAVPLPGQTAAPLGRRRTGRATSPLHAAPAAEVAGDVHEALLAAVSVPRPVFIEDLRSVTDEQTLAAWETRMRADATGPVRLIPAKGRYRHLGALVVPRDEVREVLAEFHQSLWNDCIEKFRGARVYEMGVLLRRSATQVVGAWKIDPTTVLYRLTDGRGMTGVVVFLGPDPRSEPHRADILAKVEELLGERLTLLAVLAANTEAVAPLRDLLLEEATQRRWEPTMPVALARASDFADNRTAAELLLGG